jgi:hypothetical protein
MRLLAHVESVAQASAAPGSSMPETAVPEIPKPCLVCAMSDDRRGYELGRAYQPTAIGLTGAGIVLLVVLLLVRKRAPLLVRNLGVALGVLALAGGIAMLAHAQSIHPFVVASTHEHADFAMYVRGERVDLSQPRYQSEEGHVLSDMVHMHDGNGDVVHKHAIGVTWGYFLHTIGLDIVDTAKTPDEDMAVKLPDGSALRGGAEGHWEAFVNGKPVINLRDLEIKDLDRVVLAFVANGAAPEIGKTFDSLVSSDACIPSNKCPERGKPPQESCGA